MRRRPIAIAALLILGCAGPATQDAIQHDVTNAQDAAKREDYRGAAAAMSDAIAKDPNETSLYRYRAWAYTWSGNPNAAIDDYDRLMQMDYSTDLRFNRARVYMMKGDNRAALADCQAAIDEQPNVYAGYSCRGLVYMMMSKPDAAAGDFSRSIELAPHYTANRVERGFAYGMMNRYADAQRDFEAANAIGPDVATTYVALAWLEATCPEQRFRNAPKATRDALRATTIKKWSDPLSLNALAAAHAESGDFDKAVGWQEYAIAKTTPAAVSFLATEQEILVVYKQGKPWHAGFESVKPMLPWIYLP